ncbi:hypothetical protein BC828DRAFT_374385 [Blastocladiella britannica]|nr:hypothetical protein BC828DRAFT_374385 [Blastocladiella britannica]
MSQPSRSMQDFSLSLESSATPSAPSRSAAFGAHSLWSPPPADHLPFFGGDQFFLPSDDLSVSSSLLEPHSVVSRQEHHQQQQQQQQQQQHGRGQLPPPSMLGASDRQTRVRKTSLSAVLADMDGPTSSPIMAQSSLSRRVVVQQPLPHTRKRKLSSLSAVSNVAWGWNNDPRSRKISTRIAGARSSDLHHMHRAHPTPGGIGRERPMLSSQDLTASDQSSFFAHVFDVDLAHMTTNGDSAVDASVVPPLLAGMHLVRPIRPLPASSPAIYLTHVENVSAYVCVLPLPQLRPGRASRPYPTQPPPPPKSPARSSHGFASSAQSSLPQASPPTPPPSQLHHQRKPSLSIATPPYSYSHLDAFGSSSPIPPTTPNPDTRPPDIVLMRRSDATQFVHAGSLLRAGGIESERERSIILSLEGNRVRIQNHLPPPPSPTPFANGHAPPQPLSLEGTWIPLSRARALSADYAIDVVLDTFLDAHLHDYFPPTAIEPPRQLQTHLEAVLTAGEGTDRQAVVSVAPAAVLPLSAAELLMQKKPTRLAGGGLGALDTVLVSSTGQILEPPSATSSPGNNSNESSPVTPSASLAPVVREQLLKRRLGQRPKIVGIPTPASFYSEAHSRMSAANAKGRRGSIGSTIPSFGTVSPRRLHHPDQIARMIRGEGLPDDDSDTDDDDGSNSNKDGGKQDKNQTPDIRAPLPPPPGSRAATILQMLDNGYGFDSFSSDSGSESTGSNSSSSSSSNNSRSSNNRSNSSSNLPGFGGSDTSSDDSSGSADEHVVHVVAPGRRPQAPSPVSTTTSTAQPAPTVPSPPKRPTIIRIKNVFAPPATKSAPATTAPPPTATTAGRPRRSTRAAVAAVVVAPVEPIVDRSLAFMSAQPTMTSAPAPSRMSTRGRTRTSGTTTTASASTRGGAAARGQAKQQPVHAVPPPPPLPPSAAVHAPPPRAPLAHPGVSIALPLPSGARPKTGDTTDEEATEDEEERQPAAPPQPARAVPPPARAPSSSNGAGRPAKRARVAAALAAGSPIRPPPPPIPTPMPMTGTWGSVPAPVRRGGSVMDSIQSVMANGFSHSPVAASDLQQDYEDPLAAVVSMASGGRITSGMPKRKRGSSITNGVGGGQSLLPPPPQQPHTSAPRSTAAAKRRTTAAAASVPQRRGPVMREMLPANGSTPVRAISPIVGVGATGSANGGAIKPPPPVGAPLGLHTARRGGGGSETEEDA